MDCRELLPLPVGRCERGRWTKAAPPPPRARRLRKTSGQDDSLVLHAPKDLALKPEGERKVRAMLDYIEALDLQENGESEKALEAFERVLNIDPGEIDLATRVAFLLTQQGDYPRAIDILKDAVKAEPKEPGPYLQLAYIYAKYLKKMEPAIRYAEQAVTLAPNEIEGYQRLAEVQLAARQSQRRAANTRPRGQGRNQRSRLSGLSWASFTLRSSRNRRRTPSLKSWRKSMPSFAKRLPSLRVTLRS